MRSDPDRDSLSYRADATGRSQLPGGHIRVNTYAFHAHPRNRFGFPYADVPQVTAALLSQAIPDLLVRSLSTVPSGGYDVEVQLERDSHPTALADIAGVFEQWGFTIAQTVITEWVSSIVEGALLGAGGGCVVGVSTKDAEKFVVSGLVGVVIGGILGAFTQRTQSQYAATRLNTFPGRWQIVPQPLPPTNLRWVLGPG
jgi:hypothetical protein